MGEIDPFSEDFSAFVFKIQANMNKAHRDRIAFLRICSGKFDAQMGTTVHRYILQKRLLIAKQLLAGGVAPSEACGYCGFGDYANFYRAFRSEYGATPRQYAQSVQKIG